MNARRTRKSDSLANRASTLDDVVFVLGRAYFNYVGLLERVLRERKINATIAPGMGQILFALFETDDRIIKEIAERVALSQSTLTGMLARMEKSGLIERRRDSVDGRAVRVRLTPLGRSLERQCSDVFDDIRRRLRRSLNEGEMETLRTGLCKLSGAMREREPLEAVR